MNCFTSGTKVSRYGWKDKSELFKGKVRLINRALEQGKIVGDDKVK